MWRDAVVKAEPRSEIMIDPEEIARVEAALDVFLPPIASVSEVLTEPLIAREAEQWTTAENVSLQSDDGAILVTESSGYGHHRLVGRIDGGAAGQAVTFSVLAKPVGCSKLKIELHDDGATQYVDSIFDLKCGEKSSPVCPSAQSSIRSSENGYFHLSLSFVPTASTQIHFTVAFLDANNAVVYPGRRGKAVLLRKIDMDGLLSFASVSEVLETPLIAREGKQEATAENVSLQRKDGTIEVTETFGYGYHRLLGRIDGGRADQAVTLSFLGQAGWLFQDQGRASW